MFLFGGSLIFYFLVKLPFNLSVVCSSPNEGYYLIYGMKFLNGLPPESKLLFITLYSVILKFFGFGAKSIIAVHWMQTIFVFLSGSLIFLITKKILSSDFFAGLAVLFWILIITTPTGGWGQILEFESAYALEAELICVFLSLLSIYLLMLAMPKDLKVGIKQKLLPFIAGILSVCSVMFKISGAIICISVLCWFLYLLLFNKKNLKLLRFDWYLAGFILGFLIFNFVICFLYSNLFVFWKYQYSVGSYSQKCFTSLGTFLLFLLKIMKRDSGSFSNFVMFFFTFLFVIWGLIRNLFFREELNRHSFFISLLAIWALGNFCAVMAPGEYGSYYYILVWPSVAIFLTLGLRDLFNHLKFLNTKAFKIAAVFFISIFFINRLYVVSSMYFLMAGEQTKLNLFFQPESFQDPVKLLPGSFETKNPKRVSILKLSDFVNNLLPDKNDTFYVFNFTRGHQDFSPSFYIYAKRLPPTIVFSDFLHYANYLNDRLSALKQDLVRSPPKLFIIPNLFIMKEWQEKKLNDFFDWFQAYMKSNYSHVLSFDYLHLGLEKPEKYHVFVRNK